MFEKTPFPDKPEKIYDKDGRVMDPDIAQAGAEAEDEARKFRLGIPRTDVMKDEEGDNAAEKEMEYMVKDIDNWAVDNLEIKLNTDELEKFKSIIASVKLPDDVLELLDPEGSRKFDEIEVNYKLAGLLHAYSMEFEEPIELQNACAELEKLTRSALENEKARMKEDGSS